MAAVHGVENVWLRNLVEQREADLRQYGAVLAGAVIVVAVYDIRLAALVLAAGIALAGTTGSRARRYQQARQGAEAEMETAKMLALLPAGFTVINDRAFRRFNVDHVIVGPTGVWAVESKGDTGVYKERGDVVLRNGRPMDRDPRHQARSGAAAVANVLRQETGEPWWVDPLVCLPNAKVPSGDAREAYIVEAGQLLKRVRLAPVRLAPEQRDRVVEALGRVKGSALDQVA